MDQSELIRAQAWRPPQLANWIRGKEALMDVLYCISWLPLTFQAYFLAITVILCHLNFMNQACLIVRLYRLIGPRGFDGCTDPH